MNELDGVSSYDTMNVQFYQVLQVWPLPQIKTNDEIKVSNSFFIVVVNRLHVLF